MTTKTGSNQPALLPNWLLLALPLVKISEGCKLSAYPDPATGGKPWTIGWGCTGTDSDGNDIKKGTKWTQQKADAELQHRLLFYANAIKQRVTVPLTDAQLAALVDFTYNVGIGAFETSTLLRLLNAGSYQGAAMQFQYWIHAAGRVLPGLQTRRRRDRDLFLTGAWQ